MTATQNTAPHIFGVEDDALIAGLEALRSRLCMYRGQRCDCKYGGSGRGEQTGCPEIRQAIAYLTGQFDKVHVFRAQQEQRAANTLAEVRRLLARLDES